MSRLPQNDPSHAHEAEPPQLLRPTARSIRVHPLRSEHYSSLYSVTRHLSADLELEVLFLSRTAKLEEAVLHVSGKDVEPFLDRLRDYFLDAEVWLDGV